MIYCLLWTFIREERGGNFLRLHAAGTGLGVVMGGGKGVLQFPRNVVGGVKGDSKSVPPKGARG